MPIQWPPIPAVLSLSPSPPSSYPCPVPEKAPSPPSSLTDLPIPPSVREKEPAPLLASPLSPPSAESPSYPRLELPTNEHESEADEEEVDDTTIAKWVQDFKRQHGRWCGTSPTKADLSSVSSQEVSAEAALSEEHPGVALGDSESSATSTRMSECSCDAGEITIIAENLLEETYLEESEDMMLDEKPAGSWCPDPVFEVSSDYANASSGGDETS